MAGNEKEMLHRGLRSHGILHGPGVFAVPHYPDLVFSPRERDVRDRGLHFVGLLKVRLCLI